jgi:hypothetical protein
LNKLKASARNCRFTWSAERLRPTGGEFADFFDFFDFFDSSPRGRGGKMWRTVTQPAELHKPKEE